MVWHNLQKTQIKNKGMENALTHEEIGLMFRALDFGNDVHIYLTSGAIYGGKETLIPLRALFSNFYSKETITSKEELTSLSSFSSRMAILDFILCVESDVIVSNNMAGINARWKKVRYLMFFT